MIRRSILFIFIASMCAAINTHAAEIVIRHNKVNEAPRDRWPIDLINLAVSYDTSNTFRIESTGEPVNQERLKSMVIDGQLSIMWIGTSIETEQQFRPIRVPLFKGLLGHRIFIIRKGDQARFSRVSSFTDLLQLLAGQGRYWSDTPILESAGIPVVKPVNYVNLFHMLDGERFDYYPRAVHEPWSEVGRFNDLNLTVETDLMLVYPMPLYFFVAKDNDRLARIMEAGLRKGIDDGSFDKLFMQNEDIKSALDLTNVANRRVFRINNPGLSAETPLEDKSLWFDIEASGE